MSKVFLGGTCNDSQWREKLIPKLQIGFFNPVVPDWTEECYQEELKQRKECDYCLYVITPLIAGVYSIAEVIDDSNKRPEKTIFCYLETDDIATFKNPLLKSLSKVGQMVKDNGGTWLTSLDDIATFLNQNN